MSWNFQNSKSKVLPTSYVYVKLQTERTFPLITCYEDTSQNFASVFFWYDPRYDVCWCLKTDGNIWYKLNDNESETF